MSGVVEAQQGGQCGQGRVSRGVGGAEHAGPHGGCRVFGFSSEYGGEPRGHPEQRTLPSPVATMLQRDCRGQGWRLGDHQERAWESRGETMGSGQILKAEPGDRLTDGKRG